MRLLIQRVLNASVVADGIETGSIGKGFLILLGICDRDTKETVDRMLAKTVRLRIFEDSNGKTNLSLGDVGGAVLLVSQFTLYADCRKGNRPSFTDAGSPNHAKQLYEYAAEQLNSLYGIHTETGVFGADMKVSLVNDGPFTVMLDSDALNM
jgi:D-tyrosyl-tRNA(Tyr) deacylase